MDLDTFDQIADSIVAGADHLLTHTAQVPPPTLVAARHGQIVASATLRPVTRGADARRAIAELSGIAAAADATDVVLAWEEHDLHTAVDADPPDGRTITAAWATPTTATVNRYPFHLHPVGRGGLVVTWDPPHYDLDDPLVHPVILTTLDLCWQPLRGGLKHTAVLMTHLGYQVTLAEGH